MPFSIRGSGRARGAGMLERLLRRPEGLVGLVLLGLMAALALTAPLLFPGDPLAIAGQPMLPPFTDAALPLGTDRLGRDLLAGLVHGARTSLTVGIAAAITALTLGIVVGTLAGFAGGLVDEALMRLVEAFQVVPGFLIALAFVSVFRPTLEVVVLAIALGAWTSPARLVRAEVLALRELEFVAAARVLGMHPMEIAFRQILPLALPPVLALTAVIVAEAVLVEAALSFLGLGNPNSVTWGGMIAEGRNQLRSAPHLSIFPGLALVLTVIGVHLVGEALVEAIQRRGRA